MLLARPAPTALRQSSGARVRPGQVAGLGEPGWKRSDFATRAARAEAWAVGRRTLTAPAHGQCFPPRPTWDTERSHYTWSSVHALPRAVAPLRVPGRWRGGTGVLHTRAGWEALKAPSPCWLGPAERRSAAGPAGRALQAGGSGLTGPGAWAALTETPGAGWCRAWVRV